MTFHFVSKVDLNQVECNIYEYSTIYVFHYLSKVEFYTKLTIYTAHGLIEISKQNCNIAQWNTGYVSTI